MKRIVIDASILIKLYIEENDSRQAIDAVKEARELFSPDLLWAEVGNILWKYVRRGEFVAKDATQILSDMMQMPIRTVASANVIDQALAIATETNRSVYDSLYIAVAIETKSVMLTADQRLVNALADHPLTAFICGLQR